MGVNAFTSARKVNAIGLTGGIGSGKSTVARALVNCGAVLVDTDAIARAITAQGGAALPLLAQAFGAAILGADGALDRERMRSLAFSDVATKRQLEGLLHPMIGAEAARQASAAGDRVVVFDVPLLTESSQWRQRVDRVLVVDCETSTQIERVVQRSAWSEAAVQRVIAQQATRHARRAIADAVIYNEKLSLQTLTEEMRLLWSLWFGSSANGHSTS